MKVNYYCYWRRYLTAMIVGAAALCALQGQSVEQFIADARTELRARNYSAAKEHLIMATTSASSHPEANALLGLARLMELPEQPQLAALLDRYEVAREGRNIANWTAEFDLKPETQSNWPEDGSSQEFIDALRWNVIPELIAIEDEWGRVGNSDVELVLSRQETGTGLVIIDQADLALGRAIAAALHWFILTLNAWNMDAQIEWLADLEQGNVTWEAVLHQHPELLEVSDIASLIDSKTWLLKAITNYEAASDLLRDRPPGRIRLFNIDGSREVEESDFRTKLVALKEAIESTGKFALSKREFFMPEIHFSGGLNIRHLLPRFRGNHMIYGSLLDETFNSFYQGLSAQELEAGLKSLSGDDLLKSEIQWASTTNNELAFRAGVFRGRTYELERSEDLENWELVERVTAQDSLIELADSAEGGNINRFYRLVETANPPHLERESALTLEGAEGMHYDYLPSTSSDPLDDWNFEEVEIWWRWQAPENGMVYWQLNSATYADLDIFSRGPNGRLVQAGRNNFALRAYELEATAGRDYFLKASTYDAGWLRASWSRSIAPPTSGSLTPAPTPGAPPANDLQRNSIELTGSFHRLAGDTSAATLETGEPDVQRSETGSVWYHWTSPSDGMLSIFRDYETYLNLHAFVLSESGLTPHHRSFFFDQGRFSVHAGETYYFVIRGIEWHPSTYEFSLVLESTPTNDTFANRRLVSGLPFTLRERSGAATVEAAEPPDLVINPRTSPGSVWWSWESTIDGEILLESPRTFPKSDRVAVYRGSDLSNLRPIAVGFPAKESVRVHVEMGNSYQIAVYAEAEVVLRAEAASEEASESNVEVTFTLNQPCHDVRLDSLAFGPQEEVFIGGEYGGMLQVGDQLLAGSPDGRHSLVVKLDASANPVWAIGGISKSDDTVDDMAVDAAGNVYVAGRFEGETINADDLLSCPDQTSSCSYLAKYDVNGNRLWLGNGPGTQTKLVMGPNNTIYAASGSNSQVNQYQSDGALLREIPLPFTRSWDDMVFDPERGLILAGYGSLHGDLEIDLLLIDEQGSTVWQKNVALGTGFLDEPEVGIALGDDGSLALTGTFGETLQFGDETLTNLQTEEDWFFGDDVFVAKLTSDAELIWAQRLGTHGSDYAESVEIDGDGSVYVVGSLGSSDFHSTNQPDVWRVSEAGGRPFAARFKSDGPLLELSELPIGIDGTLYDVGVRPNGKIVSVGRINTPRLLGACDSSTEYHWKGFRYATIVEEAVVADLWTP